MPRKADKQPTRTCSPSSLPFSFRSSGLQTPGSRLPHHPVIGQTVPRPGGRPPRSRVVCQLTNPNTRKSLCQGYPPIPGLLRDHARRRDQVTRSPAVPCHRLAPLQEAAGLSSASIRRKLSALAHCSITSATRLDREQSVDGVARPNEGQNEGKTPALSAGQARRIRDIPAETP